MYLYPNPSVDWQLVQDVPPLSQWQLRYAPAVAAVVNEITSSLYSLIIGCLLLRLVLETCVRVKQTHEAPWLKYQTAKFIGQKHLKMKLGSHNEGMGRLRRVKIPGYYLVSRSNNVLSKENTEWGACCMKPTFYYTPTHSRPHSLMQSNWVVTHQASDVIGWRPVKQVITEVGMFQVFSLCWKESNAPR